jgi:two-component system CheB/CheR fusion protein
MSATPPDSIEERVLALTPTPADAALTCSFLAEAGIDCSVCESLAQLCRELPVGAGALLIPEEVVNKRDAALLVEALRAQPMWSDIPVLLLTNRGADSDIAMGAMDFLPNVTVLERPVRIITLVSALRTALRARRRQYALRDQIEAVRESEERFRRLADSMPQLVWTAQDDGRVTYYNSRASDYDGLARGPDGEWPWQPIVHPEDRENTVAAWQSAVARGESYECEHRIRMADGSYRWHLSRAFRVAATHGGQWFGTATDIDELKEAEEDLRKADRRKDEFLATLAHELRNPLAPLRTGLAVMRLAGDQPQTQLAVREMMERQVAQLVRLIDDLLDVSRITRGKVELRRTRVLLGAVIDLAVETTRPMLDGRRLEVDIGAAPVYVDADPTRLAQVFSNLLDNACKFTEPDGVIRVTASVEGGDVVVAVTDDGAGIPPDKLEGVFEMFAQLDTPSHRASGGLGIGLSLVRLLVRLHGGEVRAESEGAGHGAQFVVRLPIALEPAEAQPVTRPPQVIGGRRVLVVDDNRDAAESISMLLALEGCQTEIAYDGAEGIEKARAFKPEVVFLDIGMPRMNGYDACRVLRREPGGKAMTIVALTGWGQEADRHKTRMAGFDDHLVKPVEHAALAKLLASGGPAPTRH